jgi:hypothetical protein
LLAFTCASPLLATILSRVRFGIRSLDALRGHFSIEPAQYLGVKFLCFLFAIAAAVLGWNYLHRPLEYPAGVLIASDPQQTVTSDSPLAYGNFQLTPLAHFAIDARVLHRKIYRWDKQASLVPVDLALGWGSMSDQRVLDQITISQSMRFYWFEYKMPPPISKEEIILHSTNLHVIPASPAVLESGRGEVHSAGQTLEMARAN